ncbi:hypothetical protein ACF0H5_009572 [Mactra antiquata]
MLASAPTKSEQKTPSFNNLNDLASSQVGGKIIFATDEWFAAADNLLKVEDAIFKEGEVTDYGMWMDGWETRRRRSEGHDWCVIQLGVKGMISGIDVDTSYFCGNYAPRCSIQAANLDTVYKGRDRDRTGSSASVEEYKKIQELKSEDWEYIVSLTDLQPGFQTSSHNYFTCHSNKTFSHIRLNIYPDGGIARLRVFGKASPCWDKVTDKQLIDLLSIRNGGTCTGYSRYDRGHPKNLIKYGRSQCMTDGWEIYPKASRPTIVQERRSDGKLYTSGSEWCIFQLGHTAIVSMVEIDTNHFKGNFPYTCKVEGCLQDKDSSNLQWKLLVPETRLKGHNQMFIDLQKIGTSGIGVISHVRLTISPEGGISRFRIWGNKVKTLSAKL